MLKVIDVDGLFSEFISDYVYKNVGKISPEEIENRVSELYLEFGDRKLPALDGLSPNEYYKKATAKELVELLKRHLDNGVEVPDFLCEALTEKEDGATALIDGLKKSEEEQLLLYLMNMLDGKDLTSALERLINLIEWDYTEPVREQATAMLYDYANAVKDLLLSRIDQVDIVRRACFVEILSHAEKDQRVFDLLIEEFLKNQNQIPLYAGYLGKYGDEKALPYLYEAIEKEKIDYNDFEELRFAIETLGGEYTKERDFSLDKAYKKIKESKNKPN